MENVQTAIPSFEVYSLLGCALYKAQKVEFALYGLAAHLNHLPVAQSDKRFRSLTPEEFLRGDPSDLKATLGQIVELFGEQLLIKTQDLVDFYADRNLIVHNFFRLFFSNIKGAEHRSDPELFLSGFIERAEYWGKVLKGLILEFKQGLAERHGRTAELNFSDKDIDSIESYRKHAVKFLGL